MSAARRETSRANSWITGTMGTAPGSLLLGYSRTVSPARLVVSELVGNVVHHALPDDCLARPGTGRRVGVSAYRRIGVSAYRRIGVSAYR